MCKDPAQAALFLESPSRLEPELGDNFSCPDAAASSGPAGVPVPAWEASSSLKETLSGTPGDPSSVHSHEFGACSSGGCCRSTPANTRSVDFLFGAMNVGGGGGGDGPERGRVGLAKPAFQARQGKDPGTLPETTASGGPPSSGDETRQGEAAAQFSLADVIGKANMKTLLDNPLGEGKKREGAEGAGAEFHGQGGEMAGGLSGVLSTGQMSWENILFSDDDHKPPEALQHHLQQPLQQQQQQQHQEQDQEKQRQQVDAVPRRMSWEHVESFEVKSLVSSRFLPAQSGTAQARTDPHKGGKEPGKVQKLEHLDAPKEMDPGEAHHEMGESAAGTVVHSTPRKKGAVSKAGGGALPPVTRATPEPPGSAGRPAPEAAPASSMRSLAVKRKAPGGADEVTSQGAGLPGVKGGAATPAKGDKHSKVETARGWRDRRVRLSSTTAVAFYDVQDRLGLSNASQALDWLLEQAAPAIALLPRSSLHGGLGVSGPPAPSLSAAGGAGATGGSGAGAAVPGLGSGRAAGGVVGIHAGHGGHGSLGGHGAHPVSILGRESNQLGSLIPPLPPAPGFGAGEYGAGGAAAAAAAHVAAAAASTESSSPGYQRLVGMALGAERQGALRGSLMEGGGLGAYGEGGDAVPGRPWMFPGSHGMGGARSGTPVSGPAGPVGWHEGEYMYGMPGRTMSAREGLRGRRLREGGEPGDVDVTNWEGEGGALGASGRESSNAAAASEGDASWLVGDTDWKGLESGPPVEHVGPLPWETRPAGSEVRGGRPSGPADGAVTDASVPAAGTATPVPAASSSQCGQVSESRRAGNQTAHSGRAAGSKAAALGLDEPPAGADVGGGERGGSRRGAWSGASRLGGSERAQAPLVDWLEEHADDPAAAVGDNPDLLPGFWYGRSGSEIALRYLSEGGAQGDAETQVVAEVGDGGEAVKVRAEPTGSSGGGAGGSGRETVSAPATSSRSRRGEEHAAAAAASAAMAAQAAAAAAAAVSAGSGHAQHHHWRHQQQVATWQHAPGYSAPAIPDHYYHYAAPVVPGLYQGYPADVSNIRPLAGHRGWAPHPGMAYPGMYPARAAMGMGGSPYYVGPAYVDPYGPQRYGGAPSHPGRYRERAQGGPDLREWAQAPPAQGPRFSAPEASKEEQP